MNNEVSQAKPNPFARNAKIKREESKVTPEPIEAGSLSDKPDDAPDVYTEEKATVDVQKALKASEAALTGKVEEEVDKNTPKVYTDDEVLPIFDQLLNDGYAIDDFKLGKIQVVIRTRFSWEEKALYNHMEQADVKTALSYQREFSFITMAASLVKFGDTVFEPINEGTDAEFKQSMLDRYKFISSLNSVLTDILQLKLSKFDDKQRYIVENFDKLLKAF